MTRLASWVFALFLLAGFAHAGDIVVSRAVVAAPLNPAITTAAAYFTIENHGATADALTGITTASAAQAMIHENKDNNGVMSMVMLDHLDIPSGGSATMKPGAIHVMLVKPNAPLVAGGDVPFELTFAHAGKITVTAKIVPLAAVQGN